MKKISPILFAVLIFAGCAANDESAVKEYLIVDQSSNKIINRYEYTEDTDTLVRTVSYTANEETARDIEYEYDTKGMLVKTVENIPGQPSRTVTYETKAEYDSSGKLTALIRTSSEGEVIETHFGYDETGTLRGVVEKDAKGSLLMQDY